MNKSTGWTGAHNLEVALREVTERMPRPNGKTCLDRSGSAMLTQPIKCSAAKLQSLTDQ